MCESCLADCRDLGEPLPGWSLVQAQREGRHMMSGEYGLVEGNDPSFIFGVSPTPDPLEGLSDEVIDACDPQTLAQGMAWVRKARTFGREVLSSADDLRALWRLTASMEEAGYTFENAPESPETWLFHRLGLHLSELASDVSPDES